MQHEPVPGRSAVSELCLLGVIRGRVEMLNFSNTVVKLILAKWSLDGYADFVAIFASTVMVDG
jgi:hypothetical protein